MDLPEWRIGFLIVTPTAPLSSFDTPLQSYKQNWEGDHGECEQLYLARTCACMIISFPLAGPDGIPTSFKTKNCSCSNLKLQEGVESQSETN